MFIYGLPTDVPLIWPSIPIFSEKVLGTSNKANYTLRFLVLHDFFGEKSQTRFLETLTFWKGVCSKSKHEMETRQDPCGDMFRANATRTWYTALVTLVPEVFLRREERREREKRRENLSSESGVLAPIYPGCCSISNPIRHSKAPG